MEKKLIEYLKKWCKEQKEGTDQSYVQCCIDILQIIDVAESLFSDEIPRRKRRTKAEVEASKLTQPAIIDREHVWRCIKGHYFDFPAKDKKDNDICSVCSTKKIEKNPESIPI